eukprot:SAG11_NODE_38344_length_252_cov_2.352941_1_plen_40_part_10
MATLPLQENQRELTRAARQDVADAEEALANEKAEAALKAA